MVFQRSLKIDSSISRMQKSSDLVVFGITVPCETPENAWRMNVVLNFECLFLRIFQKRTACFFTSIISNNKYKYSIYRTENDNTRRFKITDFYSLF